MKSKKGRDRGYDEREGGTPEPLPEYSVPCLMAWTCTRNIAKNIGDAMFPSSQLLPCRSAVQGFAWLPNKPRSLRKDLKLSREELAKKRFGSLIGKCS